MGESRWTEEQLQAIEARNCDLLVSAAAGSGKTAVLVERIIRRITTDDTPTDVDRLLVVTFTNAAAAEMSQRIGGAIAKKLEQEPQNLHLQNQLTLLARADIKTIHSFCLQTIREYYHLLDIDPAVRTGDPGEVRLLQKEVLDDYFEELYQSQENKGFLLLLETFGEETGDSRLKDLVLQLYNFAQGYPDPVGLLEEMAEQFALGEGETVDSCAWIDLIREGIRGNVSFAKYLLEKAMKLASSTSGFEAYLECLKKEAQGMEGLEEALEQGYAQWHMAFVQTEFPRLPAYRGEEKELAEDIKSLRNEAKDVRSKLGETYFCFGEEMQSQLIRSLYPVAKALAEMIRGFINRFGEAKKVKLMIDFHDYEHFCMEILVEKGSTIDHVVPTAAAEEIQKRYDEIMIDEYQDSNMVQEMILAAVSGESKGRNNRFMVGDVKQSIYRFRLAMPQLFNKKYLEFPLVEGGKCRKVILSKNFRSRKNVLDGANFLFRQMMSLDFGDVDYNDETALYPGATFPETQEHHHGGENEVILVESNSALEEDVMEELEDLNRRQLEAMAIANKIKEMMDQGYCVVDKESGNYRPLEYRDISILLRSMKNWGTVLDDVFGQAGLPYYAETAEGYYDVPEVDTVLNLLRLLDNPRQDIPLLSVLHSPLYNLSADDLMQMRLTGGKGLFFDCIQGYLSQGEDMQIKEKLENFMEDLTTWRRQVKVLTLHELLRYLYEESGYYDYVGMTAGGSLRQANLRLLIEKAEQFEKGSHKGLFFFIRYVEDIKTAEAESSSAKLQSEAENLVRVMTIHKSKGLEFPVVFVADTGKQFNEMDLRATVLTHQQWGYGMDYKDIEHRAVYRTLSKTALAEVIRLENLSEELRVLYVALTRAKEKLILTGTVKDMEKAMKKWAMVADGNEHRLSVFRLRRSKSYLDWVMPALLRHPHAKWIRDEFELSNDVSKKLFANEASSWKFTLKSKGDILLQAVEEKSELEEQENYFATWDTEKDFSGRREEIFNLLKWQYPHMSATKLPTKISISEVKRKYMEELLGEGDLPTIDLKLPKEVKKDRPLTAAEIGTAMHGVLESADLRVEYDEEKLNALIEEILQKGKLTEKEVMALRKKELLQFFASPLAKRMRESEVIEKERPFAMLMAAKELYLGEEYENVEDTVLINGIIDCFFVEGQGLVLLDYKSDRLYQEEAFRERYKIQLQLYKQALEQALDKKVTEVYIYSFAMGKEILL
ncbi:helicase-exonuclease AddAB subunit AddA [Anaerotignum sp. MB30-C6]|uniref:helicase-exonuclease AddAB subunit AddA n=1 Tax=Anaerotignum sp. MB30-C6 TaxID=3070814 RepID=UPI0027DC0AD3|nr:helicase-exonuclease AddAB subunit AddA [Anaerotignum sp. MB30-C6]WMI80804.1 helicase-exonuclease AddAB subunit AddA [Anaerotignum sp. MB30-C6]